MLRQIQKMLQDWHYIGFGMHVWDTLTQNASDHFLSMSSDLTKLNLPSLERLNCATCNCGGSHLLFHFCAWQSISSGSVAIIRGCTGRRGSDILLTIKRHSFPSCFDFLSSQHSSIQAQHSISQPQSSASNTASYITALVIPFSPPTNLSLSLFS